MLQSLSEKLSTEPSYDPAKWSNIQTMSAVTWNGKRDVFMKNNHPRPILSRPGDAIVRITSCTLGGFDLNSYEGWFPEVSQGDILGSEAMGIVEEILPLEPSKQEHEQSIKAGDRVVISSVLACGSCQYCRAKNTPLCELMNPSFPSSVKRKVRIARLNYANEGSGAQAQFVLVPFANINLLKIPDEMKDFMDEDLLLLSNVLPAAYHGLMESDAYLNQSESDDKNEDSTVAIWGAGPVGLMTAEIAKKLWNVRKVFIIDNIESRLQLSNKRSETIPVNFDKVQHSVAKVLNEETHGHGPCVCIDAVGFRYATSWYHKFETELTLHSESIDSISTAISTVRKGGKVVLLGDYIGNANHFPLGLLKVKGITLSGTEVPVQKYWGTLLELIKDSKISSSWLFTHSMSLEKAADAYKLFYKKKNGCVKVLLKPFP